MRERERERAREREGERPARVGRIICQATSEGRGVFFMSRCVVVVVVLRLLQSCYYYYYYYYYYYVVPVVVVVVVEEVDVQVQFVQFSSGRRDGRDGCWMRKCLAA